MQSDVKLVSLLLLSRLMSPRDSPEPRREVWEGLQHNKTMEFSTMSWIFLSNFEVNIWVGGMQVR